MQCHAGEGACLFAPKAAASHAPWMICPPLSPNVILTIINDRQLRCYEFVITVRRLLRACYATTLRYITSCSILLKQTRRKPVLPSTDIAIRVILQTRICQKRSPPQQ